MINIVKDREISEMPGSIGVVRLVCDHCPQSVGFDQEIEPLNGRKWKSVIRGVLESDPRWRYWAHANCRHTKGFQMR